MRPKNSIAACSQRARGFTGLLSITIIAMLGCTNGPVATEDIGVVRTNLEANDTGDYPREYVKQSAEEAVAQDLRLVAQEKGWTIEQARADRAAADAVGRVAAALAVTRPDIFVGSVVADEPGGEPTLLVKGRADQFVHDLIAKEDLPIRLADRQPFSLSELQDRRLRVQRTLENLGYREIGISAGIQDAGKVEVLVRKKQGLPSRAGDVISLLPEELRASTTLELTDEPVCVYEEAFGGMLLTRNGYAACTSGWSLAVNILGWIVPIGVTTAGHCSNSINGILHPGHGVHNFTYQNQHVGHLGDVQWHTSNEPILAEFYADNYDIRDTNSVEPWASISVGETICMYSRLQWKRRCLDVDSTWIACIGAAGFVDRMVRMDGDVTVLGDSGTGWSWGTRAYGGHSGNCGPKDIFTPAENFYYALGGFVYTQ